MSTRITIIVVALSVSAAASIAQSVTVTYWLGGFGEHWTNPATATPTAHGNSQPISLCPDSNMVDQPPCPCPRASGYGMGIFHLNGAIYTIFQANTHTVSNPAGDFGNYNTDPANVGDHLDAFYRYDDTGDPNYDGTYDRLPDFFALPANGQLHTLADDSVKQISTDTLPVPYRQSSSTGTTWQDGSAFTAFDGPALATDPAGSRRVYALFTVESYPADQGIGSHLLGFASVVVASGSRVIPPLWSGRWKDATSLNDGEYKLNHQLPLHTLYLKEFTPVIAFRGDTGIRGDASIFGGRYFTGLTGWYRDGYFYLFTNTLLSEDVNDHCVALPTRPVLGFFLARIRADSTGANGFGGLWLDGTKRPQLEVFQASTMGGTKSFVALPHPENIVSFSDDNKTIEGDACDKAFRQNFDGCCSNPAVPASRALIAYPNPNAYTGLAPPSANFVWQDPCGRYIILNPPGAEPDAPDIRRLRTTRVLFSFAFAITPIPAVRAIPSTRSKMPALSGIHIPLAMTTIRFMGLG